MDGHSSHYCPATIRSAAEEKVILFSLPPYTAHLTQPLDKAAIEDVSMPCEACVLQNNFSLVFSEASNIFCLAHVLTHLTEMQSIQHLKVLQTLLRKPVFHSTPQLSDVYRCVSLCYEESGRYSGRYQLWLKVNHPNSLHLQTFTAAQIH